MKTLEGPVSRHEEPLPGPWCEGLTRRGADGFVCCPWHGEHHRCIIARGTEPRLFAYGGRCAP